MVYVFYGINDFLIRKEIQKILEKENADELSCDRYDLENTSIEEIIVHADSIDLFGNKKILLVENSYIFTGTTNKKLLEQNTSTLENYLKNPNPNTILIFTIYKDKLDERKKIVKLCKEKGYLKEYNQVVDAYKTVIDLFKPFSISRENAIYLTERVGENLSILEMEIDKIKLYKGETSEITKNDIIALTSKNIDTDIFNLIDNILSGKKKEAIESYHEMIQLGNEPIMILIMLANQFRMLYQVKKLFGKGYTEKDISRELKVHWYPVRKAMSKMQNYDDKKLIHYLYQLSELDIGIKTGKVDKNIALEIFILEI